MENTIKNLFEQLDSREKKSKLMNYINGAVKEVNTQEILNILSANIVLNMTSGDSKSRTNAMIDIALRLGGKLVDADDAKISEGRVVYYYRVKNNHRFVNCICLGLINDIGKIYAEARQSYTANQTVYIVIALSEDNGDFELYNNIDGIYDNYRVVVKALGSSEPEAVLPKSESADIGSAKQTSAEVYICPNCGKEIPDNMKFCRYCGGTVNNHTPEPALSNSARKKPSSERSTQKILIVSAATIFFVIIVICAFFAGKKSNKADVEETYYSESNYAEASQAVTQSTAYQTTETTAAAQTTQKETTGSDKEYITADDFRIEGKWKNTGEDTWGQVQKNAIVTFNGTNCNFFSPYDTYAFYKNGSDYQLDTTSFMSTDTVSFTVKIIDENHIDAYTGSSIIELTRVG